MKFRIVLLLADTLLWSEPILAADLQIATNVNLENDDAQRTRSNAFVAHSIRS